MRVSRGPCRLASGALGDGERTVAAALARRIHPPPTARVLACPQTTHPEQVMAHIGIGKKKIHYLWIALGVIVLLAIAFGWASGA
jgi:hypothetical protein